MAREGAERSTSQEKNGRAKYVIRLLALAVFLGCIFIWIIMPTNTFTQKWLPKLAAHSNSTCFGSQGTMLLIYTFPILFIATLGCVYLHMAKKSNDSGMKSMGCITGKKQKVIIWRRPVVVKGPLGIVSVTEMVFLVMFTALLIWSAWISLHKFFADIKQKAAQYGLEIWGAKLDGVASMFGFIGNICLTLLFFPVARGSAVLPLLGLTSESCIRYHIWLGHLTMLFFTAHGLPYIYYWAVTHQLSEMLIWKRTNISYVAGELSLLFGLSLWVATIPRIRRKSFEIFFYTHYFYILFIVFFIFHVGLPYSCIMLPGFYLFLVDRFLRFLQSRSQVRLKSARLLPCQTVELNFSKTHELSYNPTSILFVNVPSISKLQWHPFTITSNTNLEPGSLSVVIKSDGTWSQKLYNMLSSSSIDHLNVSVEGPYGPAFTNFLRHDTLVMVSGGSGITPFISIIKELIYLTTALNLKTPKVNLICAFKNSSYLSMLDLIIPVSGNPFDPSNLQLQIEAYITREKELKSDTPIRLQSISFKPHSTDSPISPILGPYSWLWLGAIITSSFIIYLILIAIITRFYIYPIDHIPNSNKTDSLRCFFSMLVICVSIAMTSSVAFVWNKRDNDKEARQIQNIEMSPTVSPASVIQNTDREVESLPKQFLVQATKVHFGERPNLIRMLFEVKESSVGVLASGPKKMRQEVAAICSSGLADNLHFESFSFDW